MFANYFSRYGKCLGCEGVAGMSVGSEGVAGMGGDSEGGAGGL